MISSDGLAYIPEWVSHGKLAAETFFFFPRNAATHKKNQFGTIFYGPLERALKALKFKVLKKKDTL